MCLTHYGEFRFPFAALHHSSLADDAKLQVQVKVIGKSNGVGRMLVSYAGYIFDRDRWGSIAAANAVKSGISCSDSADKGNEKTGCGASSNR
jgi:hypothetical protein